MKPVAQPWPLRTVPVLFCVCFVRSVFSMFGFKSVLAYGDEVDKNVTAKSYPSFDCKPFSLYFFKSASDVNTRYDSDAYLS